MNCAFSSILVQDQLGKESVTGKSGNSLFSNVLSDEPAKPDPRQEQDSSRDDLVCAIGGRQKICIPSNYQKYDLPNMTGPTFVTIGVDIKDIPKVSDQDFSITLNAYFNVKWRDPRLLVSKDYSKEGPPDNLQVFL